MNKTRRITTLVVFLTLTVFSVFVVRAQSSQEVVNLLQALEIFVDVVSDEGWSISSIQIDRVTEDQNNEVATRLFAGNRYLVAVIGGQGINDMDIRVYDSNGTLVERGSTTEAWEIVNFDVTRTQSYVISGDLYSCGVCDGDDEHFYATIVAFSN